MHKRFSILIVSLLFAADMLSKYFFYNLQIGKELWFLEPHFNTGIARSLPVPLRLVIMFSVVAAGFFIRLWKNTLLPKRVAILLLAGLLGNLVDRIRLHGVRDFVSIGSFPVFNLADVMLNIAVMLFFIYELCACKKRAKH